MPTYNRSISDVLSDYWMGILGETVLRAVIGIVIIVGLSFPLSEYALMNPQTRPLLLGGLLCVEGIFVIVCFLLARRRVNMELHPEVFGRLFLASPPHSMDDLGQSERLLVLSILGLNRTDLALLMNLPPDNEDRIRALAKIRLAPERLNKLTTWHMIRIYWRGFLRWGI